MHTPDPPAYRRPRPGAPRVAVLGGGPGGLFTARLLKRARPDWEVHLHERHHPRDTFGFGVGLSSSTQHNLRDSDPETLEAVLAHAHHGHGSRLHSRTGAVRLDGRDQLAIARATLLRVLWDHAEESGVSLHLGEVADHRELDADVVVAADGAGSPTRQALASQLGVTVDRGRQLYLWCGTDFALPDALFAPAHTPAGVFTTHAYPYAADRSTFLVETDEQTWRDSGLEAAAGRASRESSDVSDEHAIAFLQEVFAEQLQGHKLLGNRTRWTRFRTVRCDRWHAGPVVMVGDAAHTAHYSVGSGTKLAMEDAIALTTALVEADLRDPASRSAAFDHYQQQRSPDVARLQGLAERSLLWWESYVRRLDMSPEQLAMSFVTRAGNVPLEIFAERTPEVVGPALAGYAGLPAPTGPVVPWILQQPLHRGGHAFTSRVVDPGLLPDATVANVETDIADTWGEEADRFVARCRSLVEGGATIVRLTGPATRPAVLRRLDLAERLRLDLGECPVVVDGPVELRTDLAAGLLSARIDLVSLQQNRSSA